MFDPQKNIRHIINWTREWFYENGPDATAVIGISGGKDSTITGLLLKKALGPNRVLGVIMPDGNQSDIQDARDVIKTLGIQGLEININDITNTIQSAITTQTDIKTLSQNTVTNIPPRVRMTLLYAIAASLPDKAFVVNTCNKSEDFIGYSTKNGDSAGDFGLLTDYTVSEILTMGDLFVQTKELNHHLVHKTPKDGLCGKSDEENFGFSYNILDQYILFNRCNNPEIKTKIQHMHNANLHKLRPMPYCKKLEQK